MKRLIALIITLLIFALIFMNVDRRALWENLKSTRPLPFLVALLLFTPQNFISIWRWKMMASNFIPMSWKQATGLILAGNTMNLLLPSKMGDLTKAYFLKRAGAMDLPRAINLVVFEKMLDLASLCMLALLGVAAAHLAGIKVGDDPRVFLVLSLMSASISALFLALVICFYFVPIERLPFHAQFLAFLASKPKLATLHTLFTTSHEVMQMLQARHARRGLICSISVFLWVLHLVQIYFFFLSLNAPVPLLSFASLMPLAIFIGLLPISLFGMGTRDAAIIFFFSPYHQKYVLAGVGLYVSLRYLVPALGGLPFLNHYITMAKGTKNPEPELVPPVIE